ncbi:fibroblast growth factor receptor-like isoform X2 [Acanthaster planci]|uniref:receptor protein-tyrosine kinase n=1 Tax=Acanthaster planci TaxID=133434 RepID=A0A8B7XKX3_ACAPL|nr:fibroblast growth factor receptor-like isoform X2 [Acanthaster planci]
MGAIGWYRLQRLVIGLFLYVLSVQLIIPVEADADPSRTSPRNLSVTPIKLTTVTLNWDVPLDEGVYNYDVKYWRTQNKSQVWTRHVSNRTIYSVTDLQISTNYTFTVCITGSPELSTNEVTASGILPRGPSIKKDIVTKLTRRDTENVKFKCSVDGYPRPNITWWKGNVQLKTGADIEVKQVKMIITDLIEEDSGNYRCVARNDYGTLEVNFTLEVIADYTDDYTMSSSVIKGEESTNSYDDPMPPVFVKEKLLKPNIFTVAGDKIKLHCPNKGNPHPTVVWLKNGQLNWDQQSSVHDRVTINGPKLIIDRLMPLIDEGRYTCIVSNEMGSINHTTVIDITERIATRPIITELTDQEVVVGSNVSFECKVVSDATPHIVWLKMEAPKNFTQLQTMKDKLDLIVEKWTNNLNLKCTEVMTTYLSNYSHWKCITSETLQPNLEIEKLPTVIDRDSGQDLKVQAQMLKIYNVSFDDAGMYSCLAGNYLGISRSSALLSVVAVPTLPPPTSAPVVNINRPVHWNQQKTVMVVAIACSCVILVLFCFIFLMCFKSNQRHTKNSIIVGPGKAPLIRQFSADSGQSSGPLVIGRSRLSSSLTVVSEYEVVLDPEWEFPRDRLSLGKVLGEGAFGKVVLAEAVGISNKEQTSTVAVKMLKGNASERELSDLVSELEMMKMIGKHTNIINLLGCSTQDGPLYVIVEYAHHGNLRDFLRQRRPPENAEMTVMLPGHELLTNKDLISMAYQVARGMEFLASKKAIHRDLAARNVLVTEDYIMKIADFGLARDVHYIDFYKKTTDGRLPVKWMAPEALFDRVFTTQSDVWSFGILLWEIITLGGTPYPSVPVEKMFDFLKSGKRLEQPQNCSLEIYHIMRECWHTSPGQRPTFFDLVEDLARIISLSSTQDYLDLEALGDAPVTTFVDAEFDSGNSSQHSRHSSESTV